VKALKEEKDELLAKMNEATSQLAENAARTRALEMDQELNTRIRSTRKSKK
jgi:CHASE3 domain sensor protein